MRQAQGLVEERFGVMGLMAQLMEIRRQREALAHEIDEMETLIAEQMRGRCREDLPSREDANRDNYVYGSSIPEDFMRYPADVRTLMKDHCDHAFQTLKCHHPIGERLAELRRQGENCEDRLAACGSHAQLQVLWREICDELEIIESGTGRRESRKVDTTRANLENAETPRKQD